jgi:hypothetical protein
VQLDHCIPLLKEGDLFFEVDLHSNQNLSLIFFITISIALKKADGADNSSTSCHNYLVFLVFSSIPNMLLLSLAKAIITNSTSS